MTISEIKNLVNQVAPLYPIISVDLFGSFATGNNSELSDIDLLVCFDENVASLFDLSGFKFDVQEKLSKKIDVVAGPLNKNSHLIINKRIRIYDASRQTAVN